MTMYERIMASLKPEARQKILAAFSLARQIGEEVDFRPCSSCGKTFVMVVPASVAQALDVLFPDASDNPDDGTHCAACGTREDPDVAGRIDPCTSPTPNGGTSTVADASGPPSSSSPRTTGFAPSAPGGI